MGEKSFQLKRNAGNPEMEKKKRMQEKTFSYYINAGVKMKNTVFFTRFNKQKPAYKTL